MRNRTLRIAASVLILVSFLIPCAPATGEDVQRPGRTPRVVVQAPATVAGTVEINVTATNKRIASLELYLDNVLVASYSTANATYIWDSTAVENGAHTFRAKAVDTAGRIRRSARVTVTVMNVPPVPQAEPIQETPEALVAGLYRELLGREPDAEGFAYWVEWLKYGGSYDHLRETFLSSEEYQQRQLLASAPPPPSDPVSEPSNAGLPADPPPAPAVTEPTSNTETAPGPPPTEVAPEPPASTPAPAPIALPPVSGRFGFAAGVDPSGRYLVDSGGSPFFFLGDTATRMGHMLNQSDMDLYLRTRANQGFTVILTSGFRGHPEEYPKPNAYGEWPFINDDITRPNIHSGYDYWDHIDYMVDTAAGYGLTVALVPFAVGWKDGGFRYLNGSNAYSYGRFIGGRYRNRPNILWVLGWDNSVDSEAEANIWHEMARGIEDGFGGGALITFHGAGSPTGGIGRSSTWFQAAPWLDFNMIETHIWYDQIHAVLTSDRALQPPKPMGIGEGHYENADADASIMRRQAYWSYLAGGYHVYGNLAIWGFGDTGDWKVALDTASAGQMSILRNLFTSRPWWRLVPDQSIFAWGEGGGTTLNAAARSADGDSIIAYLSSSTTVSIRMDKITSRAGIQAKWFNPINGQATVIGNFPAAGTQTFSTPGGWQDAVLLLEATEGG